MNLNDCAGTNLFSWVWRTYSLEQDEVIWLCSTNLFDWAGQIYLVEQGELTWLSRANLRGWPRWNYLVDLCSRNSLCRAGGTGFIEQDKLVWLNCAGQIYLVEQEKLIWLIVQDERWTSSLTRARSRSSEVNIGTYITTRQARWWIRGGTCRARQANTRQERWKWGRWVLEHRVTTAWYRVGNGRSHLRYGLEFIVFTITEVYRWIVLSLTSMMFTPLSSIHKFVRVQ